LTIFGQPERTFTILCTSPSATTNSASGINLTGATLNATVSANGFSAELKFEYGLTSKYFTTSASEELIMPFDESAYNFT
jgi:hypothetical protein